MSSGASRGEQGCDTGGHVVVDSRARVRDASSLLGLIIIVAALTTPASPARGQGARGVFPDPISHRDVERYADVLGVSPAQREALAQIHESYLTDFRTLRDGPIEEFLAEHPQAVSFYARIPADRSLADEAARALARLAARIRLLDESFFNRVQGILTEAQAAELLRLKRGRERTRLRQGPAWVTRSPYLLTDLVILFDQIELDPEAREATRPLVEDYERRLLAALQRLDDVTSALRREMLEQRRVHEAAIRESDLWEGAVVMRAVFEKLAALSRDVADVHRQALRHWDAVLPRPATDELHRRFCAIVYPEVTPGLGPAGALFDRLLDDESLADVARSSIEAQWRLYRDAARRIKGQMFDIIDALRASTATHPIQFSSGGDGATYYEDRAPYDDRLAALRKKLDEVNQSAARTLAEITGEPCDIPHIAPRTPKEPGRSLRVGVAAPRGVEGPRVYSYRDIPLEQLVLQFGAGAVTRFLPGPIPADDLARYAERLDLGADDEPVLAELHATYLDRYRNLGGDGPIGRARRLQRTLFQRDAGGRVELPSVRQIERLFALHRDALRAIHALDDQFHDDLLTVWGEDVEADVFDRLRRDRRRAIYRHAGPADFVPGLYRALLTIGPHERKAPRDAESIAIEPAPLLEATCADLRTEELKEIEAIVVQAEIDLTELLEDLFDARLEMELERARLLASRLTLADAGTLNAIDVQPTDAMLRLDDRIHRTLQGIRARNQATREAIAARLPASERWAFLAAYRRIGHPAVYEDPGRLHRALSAAAQMDDLDAAQRTQLDELTRTYRAEYETLTERIIASLEDRRARQRHEAERHELNERTRLRLTDILGPDRLEEIGLIP
jgi:hypothetical protein